jgi:hypothetical protein
MKHAVAMALAGLAMMTAPAAVAQKSLSAAEWDGLHKVDSKKFTAAYLAPDADFKAYTKMLIDPTEAAFRKNWQRNYNSSQLDLSQRISDDDARKMLAAAQSGFQDIFAQTYREAGYEIVTAPGPDVLRLKTYVINIDVMAPDKQGTSRSRTYSSQAGSGMLVIEARDSMSGALLARGVDQRRIGDTTWMVNRSSVSNRADIARAFKTWAGMSVDALANLKAMPPVAVAQN